MDGMNPERDPSQNQNRKLHICPDCNGELVQPVDWQELPGSNQYKTTLRCPDCEWFGTGTFSQQALEEFDVLIDEGTDELNKAYRKIVAENLQEEMDRFSQALRDDNILPEDF